MSKRAVLEVIALDAEDAVAAQGGGADRLELVTDMAADGLTPPRETFAKIRAAVDIPLRVMLRLTDGFVVDGPAPRGADSLVDAARGLRAEGADEFVFGFLDADGSPDLVTVERLIAELDGCSWTFHRAIDHAADRDALRKRLADLPGLDTYLTAGSPAGVDSGLPTLLSEAADAERGEAGYGQRLMAGGGLRLAHLPVLRAAGVAAFHIGGAARPAGWSGPVEADAVRVWREALDA
ncbi:copper homeostasis protein CutC [Streptomyces corynorhini]|uniref:Copper homeostasis protein cutC homolog n=1 Tax=Streptomyces corynorhini TaxID=2282652 RepID=A0A370B0V7_9ACTN|nr:copper homeostasis protein CutC [Streptomyces corynorhini]RDG33493.1 copper homeostasis protein CutC [Streptomyces corynorhini]